MKAMELENLTAKTDRANRQLPHHQDRWVWPLLACLLVVVWGFSVTSLWRHTWNETQKTTAKGKQNQVSWEKMLKALGNWNAYRHFTQLTGHTRHDLGCSWSVIIWVLNASPRATSSRFCLQDALGRKSVLEMTESGHWGHDLEELCISNPFCFYLYS